MNLSPTQQIPVSYTISAPGDSTLYYVQAVVRDTQSSNVVQTLNLTQVSSTPNRYTGLLNPISDGSGLGRAVDVTVTVYTDAGYSVPSQNYEIFQTAHLIIQPWLPTLGTGGVGFEYDKMIELIEIVLDEKLGGSTKEIKEDFGSVFPKQIVAANDDLKEHHEILISNVIDQINNSMEEHSGRMISSSERVHNSLTESIRQLGNFMASLIEESKKLSESGRNDFKSHAGDMKNNFSVHGERMNQMVQASSKMIKSMEGMVKNFKKTIEEKEFKYEISMEPTKMKVHNEKKNEEDKVQKKEIDVSKLL